MILDSLVQGVHPRTGTELPEDSIVAEIDVSRAMATAVLALDQLSARAARRAQLPKSVGKAWTEEEEQRLREEFDGNEPIPHIATKHARTIRAIELRLERLGLLRGDQRRIDNSFIGLSGRRDDK
jgi:hypothetical protein